MMIVFYCFDKNQLLDSQNLYLLCNAKYIKVEIMKYF